MQVAEPGLTDGVRADRLRVHWRGEGLGEGQGASGGGGGEGGPSWNRCHPRSSAVSIRAPLWDSLCPPVQTGIYREVGGRTIHRAGDVSSGREDSQLCTCSWLPGWTPLPSLGHRCLMHIYYMPASCCNKDRVHPQSRKHQPAFTDL